MSSVDSLKKWKFEIKQAIFLFRNNAIHFAVSDVLFLYFECETLYKKMLYPIAKLEKKDIKFKDLKIRINQVKDVLCMYSIEFDEITIEKIFGLKNKKLDNCSIRELRNKLAHNCTTNIIQAFVKRNESIKKDLIYFLDLFNLKEVCYEK